MGLRRPARRPHGRHWPLFGPVRSGRARLGTVCSTQEPGKRPCTGCRWAVRPTTFMSGRASWSRRASLSRTSRGSGTRSGRSGATRCSRRCARPSAATTSGASACPWRSGSTPRTGSSSSWLLTRADTSPATAASSSTTPRSGASSSRRSTATPPSTAKGCTPPDAVNWATGDRNNEAFLAQTVVMTENETLSIPNALKRERPDDYYENAATIEWPLGPTGEPFPIDGHGHPRCGLQGWRPRRDRQGVRALPGGRGLARPLSRLLRRAHAAADAEAARRSRSGSTRATRTAWPR